MKITTDLKNKFARRFCVWTKRQSPNNDCIIQFTFRIAGPRTKVAAAEALNYAKGAVEFLVQSKPAGPGLVTPIFNVNRTHITSESPFLKGGVIVFNDKLTDQYKLIKIIQHIFLLNKISYLNLVKMKISYIRGALFHRWADPTQT